MRKLTETEKEMVTENEISRLSENGRGVRRVW